MVNRASGNPFFVTETVRFMKESGIIIEVKGQGKQSKCLTSDVFGSGTMPSNGLAMCRCRFELLDEPLRLILKVGCVIGGTFTESMMKGVHPFPSQLSQLQKNLTKLVKRGYLVTDAYTRVLDDSWDHGAVLAEKLYSFSHSVLEDMIYNIMPLAQQQELHRAAARYYEAAHSRLLAMREQQQLQQEGAAREHANASYNEAATPAAYALALAHHWSHTDEPAMAAKALVDAGRDALRRFGNQEAVEHFTQAFDLVPESGGEVTSVNAVSRAKLFLMAGEAFYSLGSTPLAADHYRECLRLMNRPVVASFYARLPIRVLTRIRMVGLRMRRNLRRTVRSSRPDDVDAALCFERLAHVHQNQKQTSLLLSLKQVQHLESFGPSPQLLRAFSDIAYASSILQRFDDAERYCKLAIALSEGVDDPTALAYANRVCGLYSIGIGHWQRAVDMLQNAAEFSSLIHDWQGWYESVGYMALTNTFIGRYETARAQISTALESVREAGHNDSLAWVLCGYLACTGPTGPLVRAAGMDKLEMLENCLQEGRDEHIPLPNLLQVCGKGLAALARLNRGEFAAAEQLAGAHLFFIEKAGQLDDDDNELELAAAIGSNQRHKHSSSSTVTGTQHSVRSGAESVAGTPGDEEVEGEERQSKSSARAELRCLFTAFPRCAVVEVYLKLWDRTLSHEHHKMAHRALSSLKDLVGIFPVLRPRLHLYAGMINRLDGHSYAMMEEWRRSRVLAQQMQLAYEVGCAHYQLAIWGIHTSAQSGTKLSELERRAHVAAAQQAFAMLDSTVLAQNGADAYAVRLHLNPANHQIERGRNVTNVWPELRHEPRKATRFWRWLTKSSKRPKSSAEQGIAP
eukprot:SAG25_NODE_856_length_5047_cov_10.659931_1_plen_855_part_00